MNERSTALTEEELEDLRRKNAHKRKTTLDEWNGPKWQRFRAQNPYPKKNGLSCDNCFSELVDTTPLEIGYPPEIAVACMACGLKGKRLCWT